MKWTSVLVLVAVLVTVTAVSPATGATGFGTSTDQVGDLDTDLVTISADVAANGTATFQIRYAIRLADENETQAFEELAADIEENESTYLDRFGDRMNATVAAAQTATDREMSIEEFAVEADTSSNVGPAYGLVTYSATWTGFAAVSNDQIRIGDAVEGLFIDSDTQFRLTWEESLTATTVDPDPTERSATSVVWEGPLEFQTDEPNVTLVQVTTTPPTEESTDSAPITTETTDQTEDGGFPLLLIAVILALAAIGGGWLWYRQDSRNVTPSHSGKTDESSSTPKSDDAAQSAALLSNEERVEQYLESAGGRAKQQEIVDALEWTEAKTSQVLSEMEEAGSIEKFRIGRENVVKLAETED